MGHMQICTLTQIHNHASIPPLSFYRPDALPAAHQQRQSTEGLILDKYSIYFVIFIDIVV